MVAIFRLWSATMILLTTWAADTEVQTKCASEGVMSLSLGVRTNDTGHVNLNGRLEEPQGNGTWHVDVVYGRSTCSTKQSQTKYLTFNVTSGHVKSPSSKKKPPLGYTLFPEMGYFWRSKAALNWHAAKEACERDGAQLATAHSQAEAELLATQFSFNVPNTAEPTVCWYGASDIAQEGTFVTVTGTLLNETGYGTFYPSTPNGGTSQNCLYIIKDSGQLDDAPCGWLLAYICKVPL